MGISGFRVVSHVWSYYSGFSVVSTHIIYLLDNFPWFQHVGKFGNLGWGFHIVSKARELSTSRFPRFPKFGKHGKQCVLIFPSRFPDKKFANFWFPSDFPTWKPLVTSDILLFKYFYKPYQTIVVVFSNITFT